MAENNTSVNIGCGSTLTILGIVFIVLKLTNTVSWSWVWVLAPFWLSFGFAAGFLCVLLVVFIAAIIMDR